MSLASLRWSLSISFRSVIARGMPGAGFDFPADDAVRRLRASGIICQELRLLEPGGL